jgi:hypothetical protein
VTVVVLPIHVITATILVARSNASHADSIATDLCDKDGGVSGDSVAAMAMLRAATADVHTDSGGCIVGTERNGRKRKFYRFPCFQ